MSNRRNPLVAKLEIRTEKEWLNKINKLSEDIRKPVAYLVWWDFFASLTYYERAKGFDKYIKPDSTEYPPEKVITNLIRVGYPREMAEARLSGKGGRIHATKD